MFCNRNLNFNEEIKTNKVEKKFFIKNLKLKFEIKIKIIWERYKKF